jgi:hypothetical protein
VRDVEFEFAEPDTVDPTPAVVPSPGRHRLVAILAVLALAVLAVVVVFANRPAANRSATPVPTPPVTSSAPSTPAQAALAEVVVLAESADQLPNDYLSDREVRCPSAGVAAVVAAATAVLHSALPGYAVTDDATTRGADGTLCGLRVKARDALGATVIMTILSPTDAGNSSFVISHANDRSAVVDVGVIDAGWSVQVGWVGQTGDAITTAPLQAAAADPRLLW